MAFLFSQKTHRDLRKSEIDQMRDEQKHTRRAVAPELEKILYEELPVLDRGFIRVIDYMGNDAAIVQAARVSYGKGTKKVNDDRGLIRYLMRHHHTTPFEMCEIKLHVKLPIFVARQWVRHRTANINEYSARYSILDNEFYVPDAEYLEALREEQMLEKNEEEGQKDLFGKTKEARLSETAAQSTKNKQGRDRVLSPSEADQVLRTIRRSGEYAYEKYQELLNERDGKKIDDEKLGLARELARIVLPTNFYTQWYWKIDLYNLMHFLSLRADSHAQYEMRAYAERILEIVHKWVPAAAQAFEDFNRGSASLSADALRVVKRLIAGQPVDQAESGLSKREWAELMATLGQGNRVKGS